MPRRKIPWAEVAARARAADGRYCLHPALAVADDHLFQHMRRRVPALKPDANGVFEFARGEAGFDELGRKLYSIYIRYVPEGTEP